MQIDDISGSDACQASSNERRSRPKPERLAVKVCEDDDSQEAIELLFSAGDKLLEYLTEYFQPGKIGAPDWRDPEYQQAHRAEWARHIATIDANALQKELRRRWDEWVKQVCYIELLPPRTREYIADDVCDMFRQGEPLTELPSLTFRATKEVVIFSDGDGVGRLCLPGNVVIRITGNDRLIRYLEYGGRRDGEWTIPKLVELKLWREGNVGVRFHRIAASEAIVEQRMCPTIATWDLIVDLFRRTNRNQSSRAILAYLAKHGVQSLTSWSGTRGMRDCDLAAYMEDWMGSKARQVRLAEGKRAKGYHKVDVLRVADDNRASIMMSSDLPPSEVIGKKPANGRVL
jgi:hypothetical protein